MSASNFPHALDTDTELLRRTGSDAIVPADHNNLVDALEQVEATIGSVGDGTEQGGQQTFLAGLADYAGFLSTAQINNRHPFAPFVSASEFYGRAGATPVAWTVNPLVNVSYVNPRGLARFTPTQNVAQLIASAPVVGTDPQYVVGRFGLMGHGGNPKLAMGWSVNGLGTDIDGVHAKIAFEAGNLVVGVLGGTEIGTTWYLSNSSIYTWIILELLSGQVRGAFSVDGLLWAPWYSIGAATGTYTKFCIYQEAAAAISLQFWVDLISFGTSLPAEWSGG